MIGSLTQLFCATEERLCLRGPKGDKGHEGTRGIPGIRGERGLAGPLGPKGEKGKLISGRKDSVCYQPRSQGFSLEGGRGLPPSGEKSWERG